VRVDRIDARAFRNLHGVSLAPCAGVNVICGENGHGKTNLLEAIWLFTGARSFRGAKETELLPIGEASAELNLRFFAYRREMEMRLRCGAGSGVLINGVEEESLGAAAGNFLAVVFSPVHLTLVKGGPAERRRALDTVIAQLKPRYRRVALEYDRLLRQRNTLLKDAQLSSALIDTLDVWDDALARTGALLTRTRQTYLARLAPFAREIYDGIAGKREALAMEYEASCALDGEISEAAMREKLRRARADDLRTGMTSIGPQRDDFTISLSGLSARAYGSQGQQRSAVLAFKLGECALMEEVAEETPVVLLDDVMSELDEHRRDYLLHHLQDRQIFLTCCDPNQVASAEAIFSVENGRFSQTK